MQGGNERPAVHYRYSPDRKAERPEANLKTFRGFLQVDGYPGLRRQAARDDIVPAAWRAHTRRKFREAHQATASLIAQEVLRRIAALYAIETEIRGSEAAQR